MAIFDWDVHHGNGSQHLLDDDPSVLYISFHRYDHGKFFPRTGHLESVGKQSGTGIS